MFHVSLRGTIFSGLPFPILGMQVLLYFLARYYCSRNIAPYLLFPVHQWELRRSHKSALREHMCAPTHSYCRLGSKRYSKLVFLDVPFYQRSFKNFSECVPNGDYRRSQSTLLWLLRISCPVPLLIALGKPSCCPSSQKPHQWACLCHGLLSSFLWYHCSKHQPRDCWRGGTSKAGRPKGPALSFRSSVVALSQEWLQRSHCW